MKVEWLPPALDNLRDQVVYVGQRNLPAATELAGAVKAAAGQIAKFLYSGRKGRVPATRELPRSEQLVIAFAQNETQSLRRGVSRRGRRAGRGEAGPAIIGGIRLRLSPPYIAMPLRGS